MVIDRLDHAAQYYALGKGIETRCAGLRRMRTMAATCL
jgi:hypothetical protein